MLLLPGWNEFSDEKMQDSVIFTNALPDRQTDRQTDRRTQPIIEMRGRN